MDGAGRYKRAIENNVIPRTQAGDIIAGTLEKIGGLQIEKEDNLICLFF